MNVLESSLFDYLRPSVRAMAGYTPGEQPRQGDIIKLNTNENPYPPSPKVFEAIRHSLTGDRLRKYPDPVGTAFRRAAGRVLGVDPDGIVIGNGSDDILTILTRAFVPAGRAGRLAYAELHPVPHARRAARRALRHRPLYRRLGVAGPLAAARGEPDGPRESQLALRDVRRPRRDRTTRGASARAGAGR